MTPQSLSKKLRKIYFRVVIGYLLLIFIIYLLKDVLELVKINLKPSTLLMQSFVALSAIAGIGLPIFYRTWFVNKIRKQKDLALNQFIDFEKKLILLALITPLFLILGLSLNFNQKALILLTIFSLYALYYYYPSVKKMRFEIQLFRIKTPKDK